MSKPKKFAVPVSAGHAIGALAAIGGAVSGYGATVGDERLWAIGLIALVVVGGISALMRVATRG